MRLRKVTVISTTKSTPKVFQSEATTWEELKDNLSDFGNVNDMKVVVKENKNSLEHADAALPDSDFTLYLTPKKIKAGNNIDAVEVLRSLRDEFENAFDKVIGEVESGLHDLESEDDVFAKSAPAKKSLNAAEEAAAFFGSM